MKDKKYLYLNEIVEKCKDKLCPKCGFRASMTHSPTIGNCNPYYLSQFKKKLEDGIIQ